MKITRKLSVAVKLSGCKLYLQKTWQNVTSNRIITVWKASVWKKICLEKICLEENLSHILTRNRNYM